MRSGDVLISIPFGFERESGIERLTANFLREVQGADGLPPVRCLVTRGTWPFPQAVLFFAGAFFRCLGDVARGRVALLHLNVTARGGTLRKFLLMLIARAFRIPVVLQLHGAPYRRFYRETNGAFRAITRWMYRNADHSVVTGRVWRDFLLDELGAPADRVQVIPNGVPIPPREDVHVASSGPCRFLFVGELGQRKGVPTLIRALAHADLEPHDWRATIAGGGDVDSFRDLVHELGIADRVELPGHVDEETNRTLLRAADVAVLPSRAENLPIAVLEGMAWGLAVVATPVGAVPEIVEDDVNGLLVPVDNVEALAHALARVTDNTLRRRLGEEGRRTVEGAFSIHAYSEQLAAVYRRLLGPR